LDTFVIFNISKEIYLYPCIFCNWSARECSRLLLCNITVQWNVGYQFCLVRATVNKEANYGLDVDGGDVGGHGGGGGDGGFGGSGGSGIGGGGLSLYHWL
jgi:uncharacterized membrane protein YgcG